VPRRFTPLLVAVLAASSVACASSADEAREVAASTADDDVLRQSLSARLPDEELDVFERRAEWIDAYGAVPAACIDRVDEHDRDRAVFHGCWDWHSSVHAHWALFRMDLAGTRGHGALADAADARLGDEALTRVTDELQRSPAFEMPYGRAWLLRLVTEHEAWRRARSTAPSAAMRALGEATARSIVDAFVASPPDPRRPDYGNGAWPVAQVLAYAETTENDALATTARAWVRDHFEARPVTWRETNDADPSAFLSTYWSWVYTVATANDAERALELVHPERLPSDALTPLPDPGVASDVHHLGINWSRAWALKAIARHAIAALGRRAPLSRKLVAAYHAHVLAGRERHFRYRGDYYAYDHWVPQFAVYAITD